MREFVISNCENSPQKINDFKNNQDESSLKCFDITRSFVSIELCPGRPIDYEIFSELKPRFVSITWLGNNQETDFGKIPAISLATDLHKRGYSILLHITGRSLNKKDAVSILNYIKDIGIKNLLVLQGDPSITNSEKDFSYASDFVHFIKDKFPKDFYIGVAGYPEKHPESKDQNEDLEFLKKKVDNGADFIVTQASFNFEDIDQFVTKCKEIGISVPIIVGYLPINSCESLKKFAKFCRITIPKNILKNVESFENDFESLEKYSLNLIKDFMIKSMSHPSINGVHLFTLNKLDIVKKIVDINR